MSTRPKGEALHHAVQTAVEATAVEITLLRSVKAAYRAILDNAKADEEEWERTHWVQRRGEADKRTGLSRKQKTR